MSYLRFFDDAISKLKAERRYRIFADIERNARTFPNALCHGPQRAGEVVIWCSNDYLGMGQHPKVIAAMAAAAQKHGAGAGGTRNISGTNHPLVELEAELASLHHKEAALVFTSGWISNFAAISTIADLLPNCLILSDGYNHNSMIEGIRRSKAERKIFRHNDHAHLEELLADAGHERPKFIVFESLYSMHGTIAPVAEIAALAGIAVYEFRARGVHQIGATLHQRERLRVDHVLRFRMQRAVELGGRCDLSRCQRL
jgi:5-aminolevulinate synthase